MSYICVFVKIWNIFLYNRQNADVIEISSCIQLQKHLILPNNIWLTWANPNTQKKMSKKMKKFDAISFIPQIIDLFCLLV